MRNFFLEKTFLIFQEEKVSWKPRTAEEEKDSGVCHVDEGKSKMAKKYFDNGKIVNIINK